jgi:hypothetical protein
MQRLGLVLLGGALLTAVPAHAGPTAPAVLCDRCELTFVPGRQSWSRVRPVAPRWGHQLNPFGASDRLGGARPSTTTTSRCLDEASPASSQGRRQDGFTNLGKISQGSYGVSEQRPASGLPVPQQCPPLAATTTSPSSGCRRRLRPPRHVQEVTALDGLDSADSR